MIFYFCLPRLLLLANSLGRRLGGRLWLGRGIVAGGCVVLLAVGHMPYAALLWLIWLGGALAHVIVETGRWPVLLRWLGALACVAGIILAFKINYRFADALIGFGFIGFLSRFPFGERGLDPGLDRALASGSYGLYVIHLPIMAFLCMVFCRQGGLTPTGVPLGPPLAAMLGLMAVLVIGVSALFSRLFERRTDILRRCLLARWI